MGTGGKNKALEIGFVLEKPKARRRALKRFLSAARV